MSSKVEGDWIILAVQLCSRSVVSEERATVFQEHGSQPLLVFEPALEVRRLQAQHTLVFSLCRLFSLNDFCSFVYIYVFLFIRKFAK